MTMLYSSVHQEVLNTGLMDTETVWNTLKKLNKKDLMINKKKSRRDLWFVASNGEPVPRNWARD